MKVLFITSAYPTHRDDARGIFIHRLARGLCRQGIQVTVIAPGAPSALSVETIDDVRIYRAKYWVRHRQHLATDLSGIVPNLEQRPWLLCQVPFLIGALTWKAVRLSQSVDMIHAHWLYPAGIAGVIASRIRSIPLIVSSHGGDLNLARRSRVLTLLAKRVSLASNKCIGVSEDLCSQFGSFGVSKHQITCIPYGVDEVLGTDSCVLTSKSLETFRNLEGTRLLYVGSLNERKSVETLVDACRLLDQIGYSVNCVIVGSGPSRDKLVGLARKYSLSRVHFVDPVSPAEVRAWMAAAHLLVLPSLSEGRPVVVVEAMAVGVPVVATDIPGTRELVKHGETGFLFAPRNSEQLAKYIEIFIKDQSAYKRMGQRAREYIERESLTSSHIAKKHIALYEQLAIKD